MPTPPPTAAASPTPTPEPVVIEYTELTLGEPRTLPADVALFYRVGGCGACNACGMGFGDLRRVVFDAGAGAGEYREDRPAPATGRLQGFEVGPGGREMAAMVCHTGSCDGLYDLPSVDAEQHLWVSRDGASTWEDLGATLPAAQIVGMTGDAFLIREWNLWGDRSWYDVDGEEWEELLARLGPLGLDDLEGVPAQSPRLRWVGFDPEAPAPEVETGLSTVWWWVEGWPTWAGTPGLGGFTWLSQDSHPAGGRVWAGISANRTLLAVNDEQGVLQDVYDVTEVAAESGYGTPFVVSESLLVYDQVTCVGGSGQIAELRLVDIATGSIHPVEGLSLPMGVDEQGGNGLLYTLWRVIQFASE